MPLNLTEAARKRAAELLSKENRKYLRIKIVGGGCSGLHYAIDFADEVNEKADMVFKFGDGETSEIVVLIDRKSFLYLSNVTLDYVDSVMGSSFKFNNPTATRTCGCGDSFSV